MIGEFPSSMSDSTSFRYFRCSMYTRRSSDKTDFPLVGVLRTWTTRCFRRRRNSAATVFARGVNSLEKADLCGLLPRETGSNLVLIDRRFVPASVSPVRSRCGDVSHMGIRKLNTFHLPAAGGGGFMIICVRSLKLCRVNSIMIKS